MARCFLLVALLALTFSVASVQGVINIKSPNLVPEGLEYYNGNFFVSSIALGTVMKVDSQGVATAFVTDSRLVSSAGLQVDKTRNLLYICNTDFGKMVTGNANGFQSSLVVANLATGSVVKYIDLTNITTNFSIPRLANDVTYDEQGNLYVSDSLGNQIWKISSTTDIASIFVSDARFQGDQFFSTQFYLGPNGIEFHNNYLILAISGAAGKVFKIPVNNGVAGTPVQVTVTGATIQGLDGIAFYPGTDDLFVINNVDARFFVLKSTDGFANAVSTNVGSTSYHTPTSVTMVNGTAYVISALDFGNFPTYPIYPAISPATSGVAQLVLSSAVPLLCLMVLLALF